MKHFQIFTLSLMLAFFTACSSPVENYITEDFADTVRKDSLEAEVKNLISSLSKQVDSVVLAQNPDMNKSAELARKYRSMEKDIKNRMSAYKRTGNYSYIINIYHDAERAEAILAQSNSLKRRYSPFIKHKDKQIKDFIAALEAINCEDLLDSNTLVKNDSLTVENIASLLVGKLDNYAKPSPEETSKLASDCLSNYFVDNPTPSVISHKFQKDKDCWYIILSNDKSYLLRAIKCDDGQYKYEYKLAENSF